MLSALSMRHFLLDGFVINRVPALERCAHPVYC